MNDKTNKVIGIDFDVKSFIPMGEDWLKIYAVRVNKGRSTDVCIALHREHFESRLDDVLNPTKITLSAEDAISVQKIQEFVFFNSLWISKTKKA